MRILIVGAGIAGLSAALRLRQLGLPATVVEAAPRARSSGYMVDFFGEGVGAAHQLGLTASLQSVHDPVERLDFVDETGRTRFTLDYPTVRRRMFAGSHYNFLRGDLEGVLLKSAVDAGADVLFGRAVVAVTPSDRLGVPVSVRYGDGDVEEWDVVVGADGINSAVRQSLLEPAEWTYQELGHIVGAWIMDGIPPYVQPAAFTTLTAPGRMVAVYPVHGRQTATFFVHHSDSPEAHRSAGPHATLPHAFGDLGWIVPDLLAALPSVVDPYFDTTRQVRTDIWHRGQVVLLGDACWCVSLLAGQGASLAVAGGVALAEELASSPGDVRAALDRYRTRLRPLVQSRADSGARTAGWFVPRERTRMIVRDLSLRASTWPLVAGLIARRLGTGRPAA